MTNCYINMGLRTTLLLFFTFIISSIYGQRLNFSHLNYSYGLSNNRVMSFAEDNNGFIWIGTTTGLNRYDGYCIKTFKHLQDDSTSLPDNMIQAIVKDQLGQLWISTPKGLVVFNTENEQFATNKEVLVNSEKISFSSFDLVQTIGDSTLLLRSPNLGIVAYNIYSNQTSLFIPKAFDSTGIQMHNIVSMAVFNKLLYLVHANGVINVVDYNRKQVVRTIATISHYVESENGDFDLYVDQLKNIWVYSSDADLGLFCIRVDGSVKQINTTTKPALNSNIVTGILQDENLNLWVGTDHGGINVINNTHQSVEYILNDNTNKSSLSQNVITGLFKSSNNIIWIGTYKQGVNYYHRNLFRFFHYANHPEIKNTLPYNDVNCFTEDKDGNIYIGTNGDGLIYFNRKEKSFTKILKNELKSEVIVSLLFDSNNKLWIGTYYGGLACYDGKQTINYLHDQANTKSISDNRVWNIFEDSQGNLWVGTLGGGLDLFDRKKNVFIHYTGDGVNAINSKFVMDITEDEKGNLWFVSDYGVFMLEQKSSRFIHFSQDVNNPKSISSNFVRKIFVDSRNNVWIGTREGLNLFNKQSESFIKFTTYNGLPDNSIMGILESDAGDLWISTSAGLCKLTVEFDEEGGYLNHITINFNESDGLQGREFNEGSAFKTSAGELIFGGANGFNLFTPENDYQIKEPLKTFILDLQVFGKAYDVKINDTDKNKVNVALLNNSEIHLTNKERIFSLQFVALNYLASEKINYRYKLVGFNEQWIYTGGADRKATFTNLNQGTYTFIVQASIYNSDWTQSESQMQIVIHPPWYRTWLAYILYYVLLVFIIIYLRKIVITKERIKYQREEAIKESERLQELNVLKTRFFTNVSHEFRTPLTLILTPLEKLLKNTKDIDTYRHLDLMNQNAKRLLLLVNQLLDFRKAEANKLSLNLIYGNIIEYVNQVVNSFADFQESKKVSLEFMPDEKEILMQFDKDKVEKIILNLLSNAFKFTKEGGSIKVFAQVNFEGEQEWLRIKVKDSGIGISDDDQAKIFDRFYQSELPDNFITSGSGIGLSLTSDFVKLHGGEITVKSKSGQGSEFVVSLPVNRHKLTQNTDLIHEDEEPEGYVISKEATSIEYKKTILLVEDNADFRYYLKDSLKANYKILEVANGKMAMDLIKDNQPDLIVSDVMMPEMDGFELCKEIKTNTSFSHIPIILLTAKATQNDKLEGLEHGADDYITKPFSLDILVSRISYLLNLRKKFISEYQKSFEVNTDDNSLTPIDKKLLDKVMELINKNISNSEYSVEKLSKELSISRVYLYKKLSSLTGKTPIELIRLVRLKRASELLMQGQLNVSEITYEVGYSDPKYFSKQFKAEFGELPSKFKENQNS